jgi:hypothetical protein
MYHNRDNFTVQSPYYDPAFEFNAPKFCDLEREMRKELGEIQSSEESFISCEDWFNIHHM